MKKQMMSFFVITAGSALYALAFNWFFAPNQLAMGGLTGLAQVINAIVPQLSVGLLLIVMNVPLFLLGWKFLGGRVLLSSLYAMTVSSAFMDIIAYFHTFQPMDPMLACLCGGALMGFGLGVVLVRGATTGGTELAARLVKLKIRWLPLGKLLMLLDLTVVAVVALVFRQVQSALYGVVALYLLSKVIDMVLYGMDASKVAYIISDHWKEVAEAVLRFDRGVTLLHAEGAWSGAERKVLLVAFKQREIVEIKKIVYTLDPGAFLIVCDAHEVQGEGFRAYTKEEI